jgi:hypothetical protein
MVSVQYWTIAQQGNLVRRIDGYSQRIAGNFLFEMVQYCTAINSSPADYHSDPKKLLDGSYSEAHWVGTGEYAIT